MGHYIVISASRVSVLKLGVVICVVPKANPVAAGEVNCYNSTPDIPQLYGDDRPGVVTTIGL